MGNVSFDSLSLIVAFKRVVATYASKGNISRKHTKFLLFIGENEIIHSYFYSFNSALIAYLQSVEVDKSLDILDIMERIFEWGNNAEKRDT